MRAMGVLKLVTLLFLTQACGTADTVYIEPTTPVESPPDAPTENDTETSHQPDATSPADSDAAHAPKVPSNTADVVEPSQFKVLYNKVEFKVFLPAGFSKAKSTRLALFLHGDTANGYYENYFTSLKTYALKRGFIFAAALSPNGNSWWHENEFATDLHLALTTLKKRLNFSTKDILFSGVSGGSTFLTMQFIPMVGKNYSGTIAATCGGAPGSAFRTNEIAQLKTSYDLNFIYRDGDFLADPNGTYGDVISKTIRQYNDYGFKVAKKVIPRILPNETAAEAAMPTHCRFDVNDEIIKIWSTH